MNREELLSTKEYVVSQIQLNLLNLIGDYKKKNKLKDFQLADELGVSKGYVSQLLNVTFDHKISKLVDLALACDLFLAIGSSLVVWPAAGFPLMAKRNGARLVIINREPTEFDEMADLVVRQDIGTVLEPFIVH